MLELIVNTTLQDSPWLTQLNLNLLKTRMNILFAASGCPELAEASVVLTDDSEIHYLNKTWRQVDSPTDVLAFPMLEGPGAEFVGHMLGDVVISLETAASQVSSANHQTRVTHNSSPHWTLDDEVTFLTIHGLLHLLGHDHYDPEETALMRSEEQRIWAALLGDTNTPSLETPNP